MKKWLLRIAVALVALFLAPLVAWSAYVAWLALTGASFN
jgi:hypothetical protein